MLRKGEAEDMPNYVFKAQSYTLGILLNMTLFQSNQHNTCTTINVISVDVDGMSSCLNVQLNLVTLMSHMLQTVKKSPIYVITK